MVFSLSRTVFASQLTAVSIQQNNAGLNLGLDCSFHDVDVYSNLRPLLIVNPCCRRCRWIIHHVFFSGTVYAADIDADLVEKCCNLGSAWSESTRGTCVTYPRANLTVGYNNEESCLSLIDVCCAMTSRSAQCDVGRDVARNTDSCSSIRVQRGNTDVFSQRKVWICCQFNILNLASWGHSMLRFKIKFYCVGWLNNF